MFNKINLFFENKSRAFSAVLSLIFIIITALFDYYTGFELSFSIFYMLPISIATWYNGRNPGMLLSIFSAFVWFMVDHFSGHVYSNAAIPYWNGFVRFGFFILITVLIFEIKILLRRETEFARQDNLTGLLNARFFKDSTQAQMEVAARHKHKIVFGYIDLDNFKKVNDTMGHSEGDRVLKSVGDVLKASIRASDLAGRLGGDEFVVFLPETDHEGAELVFKKIHDRLAQVMKENKWPVGFSIGIAIFNNIPGRVDDALQFADNLMYNVKNSGKNNILYEEYT
jgi:diguanylate cyclase (GGDEF)-like protein